LEIINTYIPTVGPRSYHFIQKCRNSGVRLIDLLLSAASSIFCRGTARYIIGYRVDKVLCHTAPTENQGTGVREQGSTPIQVRKTQVLRLRTLRVLRSG